MGLTSHNIGRFLCRWLAVLIVGAAVFAFPANAQAARGFSNATSGSINLFTSCSSPLVRNFTVTSNFLVGDVDLGVRATHTWRGDIQITLQSPQGTRQQLVNGDAGAIEGDNFNVLLNDSGTQRVNTDGATGNHSTASAPPYQHTFSPDAPLSVFNGQQSAGTWRLEICDIFTSADDGTFAQSDLYLTPATNASGTGATFVVTSTADSGTATLRQAVIDANATSTEADAIAFAIAGAGPHTITLSSVLPNLTDSGLVIDGTTQSGTQCRDLWAGSGHDLRINLRGGSGFDGLRPAGANQTIRGLSISGFANGVAPQSTSTNATVQCSYLGLLANGTSNGNTGRGANIFGASARIGGLNAGEGNIISANGIAGVVTNNGSTDTSIRGNFIGTDVAGLAARANGTGINNFNGSVTWREITGNLISGNNGLAGIALEADDRITPSNGTVRIQRNRIGFNRTLTGLLLNGGNGIRFDSGSITNVLIGGTVSTEGNEIAGNSEGIWVLNAANVSIQGNTIARSGGTGMRLNNVNGGTIGGDAATLGNTIGGNAGDGIYLLGGSRNLAIEGNQIGRATVTSGNFDNQGHGISMDTVSNITIGNGSASGRNVISRNGRRGIQGVGTTAGITINGNYIGTDASGNVAVTNGQNEGTVTRDAISFDQGGSISNFAVLNNVIGGYQAAQIEFWSSSGNGITIQGNNIGVGADGVSSIVSGNVEDHVYTGGGGSISNVLIGGSSIGQPNLIAFSSQSGIRLESAGTNIQVIGNTIRNNTRNGIYLLGSTQAAIVSNRIYTNGLLGIDLGDNGVTANDSGDGDSGPNNLLNFPLINYANPVGTSQLAYSLTLDAPAAASGYRIEFFANSAADSTNHGEGERYLGFLDVAHAGGAQTYTGTLTTLEPIGSGSISTTATRRTAGGAWDITSEFSAVVSTGGLAALSATMTSELFEPPPASPFATPGNDVILSMTVQNTGAGYTDLDSIFVAMSVSSDNVFYNTATPSLGGVVGFTSGSPLLTFNPATDLAFSSATTRPTSFAQCTYTPQPGYDPLVKHLCLNPKGTLPNGSPTGEFTIRIRARIR